MNLIDSYVCEVGRWLPGFKRKQRLARLREDLCELLHDARDDDERRVRLSQFGRPVVVAARYADFPHVIPGMLAPAYILVLLVSTAVMLLVNTSLVIPRSIHGETWLSNLSLVVTTSLHAFTVLFTVITLVFYGLSYAVQYRTGIDRK